MAREVISWCDRHLHQHHEHVVASEVRVGVDGQWWSTDLCDMCAKELVSPVARLLVDHGSPILEAGAKSLQKKSPQKAWAAAKSDPEAFPPTDVTPSAKMLALHEENLERRRTGKRRGRTPESSEMVAPCIFCGIELRDGGNPAHLQIHGFSSIGRSLGTKCPYCGVVRTGLGVHLQKSHSTLVQKGRMILARELLQAHLNQARFDVIPALRARALNVEPLETVLRALVDA